MRVGKSELSYIAIFSVMVYLSSLTILALHLSDYSSLLCVMQRQKHEYTLTVNPHSPTITEVREREHQFTVQGLDRSVYERTTDQRRLTNDQTTTTH